MTRPAAHIREPAEVEAGVRAALVHDVFSAHPGVEDDDMDICRLGGAVIGARYAQDLIHVFLQARFSGASRHQRRLEKVRALENRSCER